MKVAMIEIRCCNDCPFKERNILGSGTVNFSFYCGKTGYMISGDGKSLPKECPYLVVDDEDE